MLVFCHCRCKFRFLHACIVGITVILYDSIMGKSTLHKLRHRDFCRTYPGQVAPRKSPVRKLSEQPVGRHLQYVSKLCLLSVINKNLRPQSTGRYQQLIFIRRKLRHLLQIIRFVTRMSVFAHRQDGRCFLIPNQKPKVKIIGQVLILNNLHARIKRHNHCPQVVVI